MVGCSFRIGNESGGIVEMNIVLKKIMSLIIAVVLLSSFAQVAMAEDDTGNSSNGHEEVYIATPVPITPAPATPVPETPVPVTPAPATEAPATAVPEAPPGETDNGGDAGADWPTDGDDFPQDPKPEPTEAPTPKPQRTVWVILYGEPGSFQYGDLVRMEAMLSGFEGASYTITWEYNPDGLDKWYTAPGNSHGDQYQLTLDQENALWFWRVVVIVK